MTDKHREKLKRMMAELETRVADLRVALHADSGVAQDKKPEKCPYCLQGRLDCVCHAGSA